MNFDNDINKITDLVDRFNKSDSIYTIKIYINRKQIETILTFEQIMEIVCNETKFTPEQIRQKTRKREIKTARQMCHYLAKRKTKKSLTEIGLYFGNKDHSTVLNSIKSIQNYLDTDSEFREKYKLLTE